MLYLSGSGDMARYALDQPMADAPGARWNYSGGNVNLLMAELGRFAGEGYEELPWRLLFDPLGMGREGPVVVERDAAGTFVGSSYVHMTPRDMARLGQLHLQDGVWEGRRILPEGWVEAARTPVAVQGRLELGPDYIAYVDREGLYGQRSFWLNLEVPGLATQFPQAPRDLYLAAGHYGQIILILPSQGLVIARTGHDAEYWSKIDALATKAIACFAP
jgi:CubicO group peptidase (beta-lactamase class C family)